MTDRPDLGAILEAAARGSFPPPDGSVRVLPSPAGRSDAVVAFTAHHVVAADVDPDAVRRQLGANTDLGAPLKPEFLRWLGDELGSEPGSVDVVLAASGAGDRESQVELRREQRSDPRVRRAERYRDDVESYVGAGGAAVVVIGRGLAGRREIAIEIDDAVRDRGLARQVLSAARALVPGDEVLFAQIAAGNAASLRAFLAAGFQPIGSEVLFLRNRGPL